MTNIPSELSRQGVISDEVIRDIRGERFVFHRDRAIFWPRHQLLMLADTHFGKDLHLQRAGMAVPQVADQHDLARLQRLLGNYQPRQLLLLGDVFHARPSGRERVIQQWKTSLALVPQLEVIAIEGNHDRHGGRRLDFLRWQKHLDIDGFRFQHDPPTHQGTGPFVFCGHLHPKVRLGESRLDRVTLPCFWIRPHCCVLPPFGLLTAGATVSPQAGDEFVVLTPDGAAWI